MNLLELMRSVALFEGLNDEQLQRLVDISDEEVFHDGDVVFEQGATGDRLYFVVEGQVAVRLQHLPDQRPRTQVYLGRGQVIGEMALLDKGPRSATIKCRRDNTVMRSISHAAFIALCDHDTTIGYIVMRNLARDLSFKLRHSNLDLGTG